MNILITGAKGQLGSEIIEILKSLKSDIGDINVAYKDCNIISVDVDALDITDFKCVNEFILNNKPDIIINCAAMTNVDACETNLEAAMKVNAIGPRNLAFAARNINAKLVHVSTDYVFEGTGSIPYCEWDICNPKSVYGKSKLLGEKYVLEQNPKSFIIRTSWLYGMNGNNFVKTMLKLLEEKSEIKVVYDQRGNPTNANDLAYHILKVALTDEYGVYHCTGNGECSWFEFTKEIKKLSGLNCEVIPCTTDEFPRPAKRPSFSSLNNLMLKSTVGDDMRDWKVALEQFILKLKNNI